MAKAKTPAALCKQGPRQDVIKASHIVDAPEHHAYARAMGLLTWSTWDTDLRPVSERIKDFLQAYPIQVPTRFQGTMLSRSPDGDYIPASSDERRRRLFGPQNSFGSLGEVLARYGLKLLSGPPYSAPRVEIRAFREVAQLRNQRLRDLYGRVDVEADNMDDAKAAELEKLERVRAAEQIREARRRMHEDH
jgi:hypothetical protein